MQAAPAGRSVYDKQLTCARHLTVLLYATPTVDYLDCPFTESLGLQAI